jgi:oxygen-independent coproporphyrinogen-3 oxidase
VHYNYSAPTRSLYIHWPFCPYKCHFCPFVAISAHDQFMEQYHRALCKEINTFADSVSGKLPIDTIFMGGGTPSTYPNHLLLDMLGTLRNRFDIMPTCEITLEVNPGTVSLDKLEAWKEGGINRLSIGVQSLKDSVLKNLNRHQSAADVAYAITHAHALFENLSVDLIIGLPGVTEAEWKEVLRNVVAWPLKHVSVYFLTVHEDTPLYFKVKNQKAVLPCDDALVDLYSWSVDFLAAHGIHRYEVSNFARSGFESRHNRIYWERKPYKAFGLGACSFDGMRRFQNEKNLMKYMAAIDSDTTVTTFSEELTREQVYLERMMLGIRQSKGIMVSELMEGLLEDQKAHVLTHIQSLKEHGFVCEDSQRLVLTPKGLSVENSIALQLSL